MIDASCCCGNVLIWQANTAVGASYTVLTALYEAMGLTVHTNSNWSGVLADYSLIIWVAAQSDPSWWSEITGNTWPGRLVLTCEHAGFPTTIAYINGLSALTGMSAISDLIDTGCFHTGTVEADPLTVGQGPIQYALTSEIAGGTPLSRTATGSKVWLAHNKPSGSIIDFVLAGDSNWIDNSCGGVVANNAALLQNFWNVAI